LCDYDHRPHVEAQVEALLVTVSEDIPVNFWPCDVSKEIQSLKLGKACSFDCVTNECLRHLPRTLVHLTHSLAAFVLVTSWPLGWQKS
jgi:hypothetical protein